VTCECDEDVDCALGAFCDVTGPGRVCSCITAYEVDGAGCTFAGAPADSGFQDPTLWTVTGQAEIDPLAAGNVNPGEAIFEGDAVCGFDSVSQLFEMPPADRAEPLAITIGYRSFGGFDFFERTGAAFAINGGWTFLPTLFGSGFEEQTFCLGERGFGGPVEFLVAAAEKPGFGCEGGFEEPGVAVDRLEVGLADAGQCPPIGEVLNAYFEADGGWTFLAGGTNANAEIRDGAGLDDSAGLELTTQTLCSLASGTGTLSAPLASTVPSPAIDFHYVATSGREFDVAIAGRNVARLIGAGAPRRATVCIPEWAQGMASTLRFALQSTSGTCANPDVRLLQVDDIVVRSEDACGSGLLVDPGFEAVLSSIAPGWVLTASVGAEAVILNDPNRARTGSGVLELAVSKRCAGASATATVTVPAPESGAGPAVKLFQSSGANALTTLRATASGNSVTIESGGNVYQAATLCLRPEFAGRPVPLTINIPSVSGTCADTFAREAYLVDDIEVTTDSSCPTE
jgi:hypothetical protein